MTNFIYSIFLLISLQQKKRKCIYIIRKHTMKMIRSCGFQKKLTICIDTQNNSFRINKLKKMKKNA